MDQGIMFGFLSNIWLKAAIVVGALGIIVSLWFYALSLSSKLDVARANFAIAEEANKTNLETIAKLQNFNKRLADKVVELQRSYNVAEKEADKIRKEIENIEPDVLNPEETEKRINDIFNKSFGYDGDASNIR